GSVGEGEAALPDTLALHDREPGDLWRQHVTHEAGDLGSVGAIVAVVDLADQAVSGTQPRHHRGALEDRIGAAPEVPGQRNVDGDRLDGVDLSRAQGLSSIVESLPGRRSSLGRSTADPHGSAGSTWRPDRSRKRWIWGQGRGRTEQRAVRGGKDLLPSSLRRKPRADDGVRGNRARRLSIS